MPRIGVLALQGSVIEHFEMLSRIDGVIPVEVKKEDDILEIDGLIMPGGESTTIGKLLKDFKLKLPLIRSVEEGMPVWGTCAGMILLAKRIIDEQYFHLGLMDIEVRRNAFGSQLDSFKTSIMIPEISENELPLVFIRAPWIETAGRGVSVLAEYNGKIIAARQNNMLATSFHPELTDDLSFHRYFADMIEKTV